MRVGVSDGSEEDLGQMVLTEDALRQQVRDAQLLQLLRGWHRQLGDVTHGFVFEMDDESWGFDVQRLRSPWCY